ncbi:DNA damage-regulated autophagy modulator protein 1 isoform X2 [Mauremys reevesii]|uniref:DNA damage-regulated autophagy modulator protein 1 isoform X2 n=1 Tax=Mauremys reevesii TaxID=260615 RepID=UPI00193F84F0|nr:DNA damage-regulated autophagy modulator protein 1 isoform X2 [Mauremys reevesii]
MLCFMPGVAFIPALLVCWSSAAFIISYVIAVLGGHVEPLVPYISDTGTKPPESGIFGFMINISAFLAAATMYIRYLIIEKQNESSIFMSPSCNLITLCIGLLGCIGMGIVANFQSRERELLDQTQEELQEQSWQYQCNIKSSQYCNEEKRELSVPSVHDGGALVAFGSGVVYITLQSVISFKSCPQWNSHSTCYIRIAISIVSWIAVIPMIACASLISITKVDWIPGEKGVTLRILTEMHEDF